MSYNTQEIINISLNASFLAIAYTLFGALISYIFYYIFDEFDEKWKKRSELYKFTDVTLEITVIALGAFWALEIIRPLPPLFKVKKTIDIMIDSYISGIFFVFAIFLFLDQLIEKLKFLHDEYLGGHFKYLFPQYGHLLDLSLSYTPPKTKTN